MQEDDYTFVTLDGSNDFVDWTDAVVIDVDSENDFASAIVIDEDFCSDFITLSDDTVMLSDEDMLDISSTDMDIDSSTITFGV